jgi:hypothetical protein
MAEVSDPMQHQGTGPHDASLVGWHPDPSGQHQYRFFDGTTWTEHVADDGVVAAPPATAAPSIPPQPGTQQPAAHQPAAPAITPQPTAHQAAAHQPVAPQPAAPQAEAAQVIAPQPAVGDPVVVRRSRRAPFIAPDPDSKAPADVVISRNWAAGRSPRRDTGLTRNRIIAGDLPDWAPLPPGELRVARRGGSAP